MITFLLYCTVRELFAIRICDSTDDEQVLQYQYYDTLLHMHLVVGS
jgi:hypothetical protein